MDTKDTVKNEDLQKKKKKKNWKTVSMATIKMADSQNAVLTKTEISQKLFWVSTWNLHHLLIRGYCMQ